MNLVSLFWLYKLHYPFNNNHSNLVCPQVKSWRSSTDWNEKCLLIQKKVRGRGRNIIYFTFGCCFICNVTSLLFGLILINFVYFLTDFGSYFFIFLFDNIFLSICLIWFTVSLFRFFLTSFCPVVVCNASHCSIMIYFNW